MSLRLSWISLAVTLGVCASSWAGPATDSGALDPTFGSAGKVQVSFGQATQVALPGSIVATDMAIQADGKILVAGYEDYILTGTTHYYGWIEGRFNEDGSIDSSFGGFGLGFTAQYVGGHVENQATSVAIRPNGKIVVGGTIRDDNNGLVTAVVIQLNADGTFDNSWGNNGSVYFTPAAGDSTSLRAIVLDTVDQYALGNLYLVGQYTHAGSPTCNNFFYAGISPDGKTKVSNDYQASESCNTSESATSVAIQPGTGNVIVGGYSAFVSGSTRCTAISTVIVPSPVFPSAYLYTGWGTNGATSFTVNGAQFPNDFCDSMTITSGGSAFLAGHGTVATGSGTYQAAIIGWLDANGVVVSYGLGTQALTSFDFTESSLIVNDANTVNKLIVQPYGSLLLPAGYNNDSHNAPYAGDDFAFERFSVSSQNGVLRDSSFNTGAGVMLDWGSYHTPVSSYVSNERVQSAAFDPQGRLIVAGYTSDSAGGTDIAIARFAPFDGIFKSGFETPSY
jgi:uncharacterized delta-60 repeat protein